MAALEYKKKKEEQMALEKVLKEQQERNRRLEISEHYEKDKERLRQRLTEL